jgi:hypothetical protein
MALNVLMISKSSVDLFQLLYLQIRWISLRKSLIKQDDIQKVMKDYKYLGLYITSAKTGQRVSIAFENIIKELYNTFKN